MLRLLNLFFFLPVAFLTIAQNSEIDSLKSQLTKAHSNLDKSTLYAELSEAFYYVHPDSINFYADLTIKYAERAKNRSLIGSGLHRKGIASRGNGDYIEAISYFKEALKIREDLKDNVLVASTILGIGNANLGIGKVHEDASQPEDALIYYRKAHSDYLKALSFIRNSNDSTILASTHHNIGASYYRLTEYDPKVSYDSAIRNFEMSYRWTPHLEKLIYFGESKMLILICKYEKGLLNGKIDNNELEESYSELVEHFIQYGQIKQLISCNISLAGTIWSDNVSRSESLLIEADSLAKFSNFIEYEIQANQYLYELNDEVCNYKKALEYFEKVTYLKSNIISTETKSRIEELELMYDTEKIEKKLEKTKTLKAQGDLENARLWWTLGGAMFVALGIVLFLIQRQRISRLKQKQEREEHSKEINDLLKNQELESIESMLAGQETERKRIAEDLHDKLGSTLSAAKMYFEASSDSDNNPQHYKVCELLDRAVDDTREIAHNLVSGILSKFGLFVALKDLKNTVEGTGSVQVKLDIDTFEERFHSDIEIQLYRITQEAFSNALKHGNATLLTAQFIQKDNHVAVLITDNGNGFNQNKVTTGMGLKNLQSRVLKLGGTLQIDSTKGQGTSLSFSLKPIS